jgi:hypothetical protein
VLGFSLVNLLTMLILVVLIGAGDFWLLRLTMKLFQRERLLVRER